MAHLSHNPDVRTQCTRTLATRQRRRVVVFASHAVRCDADKIGWLPWQCYDKADEDGTLVSVTRDGDLVGFCMFREPNTHAESKIIQTWVREDARMIEHGRALVRRVARIAMARGALALSCWVAQDLAAMRFWPAVGFTPITERLGRGDMVRLASRRSAPRILTQFWCDLRTPTPTPTGDTPWQNQPSILTPAPLSLSCDSGVRCKHSATSS